MFDSCEFFMEDRRRCYKLYTENGVKIKPLLLE